MSYSAVNENSGPILGRYKGCTNASYILTGCWVYGEYENVIPHLVQTARKPWRVFKFICHPQRRIMPSMEIQANSGPILSRYKGCTDASNISTRSWRYGDFEDVIHHSDASNLSTRSWGYGEFEKVIHLRCKERTNRDGPSNLFVTFNAV